MSRKNRIGSGIIRRTRRQENKIIRIIVSNRKNNHRRVRDITRR